MIYHCTFYDMKVVCDHPDFDNWDIDRMKPYSEKTINRHAYGYNDKKGSLSVSAIIKSLRGCYITKRKRTNPAGKYIVGRRAVLLQ